MSKFVRGQYLNTELKKENAVLRERAEREKREADRFYVALARVGDVARSYSWLPAGELGCYAAYGSGEPEELTPDAMRAEMKRCLDETLRIVAEARCEDH